VELDVMVGAFADLGDRMERLERKGIDWKPIYRRLGGSGLTIASGFGDYGLAVLTDTPNAGRVYCIRAIHLLAGANPNFPLASGATVLPESIGGAYNTSFFDQGFSANFAATAAGTLTIISAYTTGFRIDPAAAWPAGVNQVTITNLNGGTQTYDLPGGTTSPLIVMFPQPIPQPFGNPVISVPAIAGGPAYTINAFARNVGNNVINTAVDLYVGQPPESPAPPTNVPTLHFPSLNGLFDSNLGPLPIHKEYKENGYWVYHGDQIFAIFNAVPGALQQVVFLADVEDWPVEAVMAMRA